MLTLLGGHKKEADHSLSLRHSHLHQDDMFCRTDVMYRAPIFSHRQMSFNNADKAELCQINVAISQLTSLYCWCLWWRCLTGSPVVGTVTQILLFSREKEEERRRVHSNMFTGYNNDKFWNFDKAKDFVNTNVILLIISLTLAMMCGKLFSFPIIFCVFMF